MKAINYYVVIEKIKEAPKKVGGLELTEDQNKDVRYLKGKVISAGNSRINTYQCTGNFLTSNSLIF